MDVILLFMSAAVICVTLGGLGLHFTNKKRIEELEEAILAYDKELIRYKKDIRVLKERAAQNSDRAYIVHIPSDDDVKYGGF